MLTAATRRWTRTLTGFAGFGGLSWLSSVLTSTTRPCAEDLPFDALAGAETRYLSINGHPVACRTRGEGPTTILFLHGFGGRMETWAPLQEIFARQCRTVALDLWGFGASGRPADLTPKAWVRQVYGALDALGIERAVFVGHSLGGRVSLLCAEDAPDRVRGLMLCDSDWGQAMHGYYLAWGIAFTPAMATVLARIRGNPRHIHGLLRIAYSRGFPLTDAFLARSHDPVRVHGTETTYTSLARAHPLESVPKSVGDMACPATVIWGEHDGVIPVEWAAPLARKLPDAELAIIPDCAHCPQDERPDLVAEHLERLLDRVESRDR